jgi:hypothetical protein
MTPILTPDRFITVLGLAICIISFLTFRKMSHRLFGIVILTTAILFAAQTWFYFNFERSVLKAKPFVLNYIAEGTKSEWMVKKNLILSFEPAVIDRAFSDLQSEGIIERKFIEMVHNGPNGEVTVELPVYCNPKARQQAGLSPRCD